MSGSRIKKLSGPALERYLKRFFAAEPGLSGEVAQRLAQRASAAFSSVRVRASLSIATTPAVPKPGAPPPSATIAKPSTPEPPAPPQAADDAGDFDAYAIGLVPTFQREGRDGLIAKLGSVTSAANLRKMARAQQIVLPEAMRGDGASIDELRLAIADAVAKRIADRRAAAG